MQIDFGAAIDRVNHLGVLNKLCSVALLKIKAGAPARLVDLGSDGRS